MILQQLRNDVNWNKGADNKTGEDNYMKAKNKLSSDRKPVYLPETSIHTKSFNDLQFSIPPPGDDTISAAAGISQLMHGEFSAYIREREKTSIEIREIMTEGRAKLMKLIGDTTYNTILDYNRQQRISNYGLNKFRHDRDGYLKLAAAKQKAKEHVQSLLGKTNAKPGKIRQLNREIADKFRSLLQPVYQSKEHLEIVERSKVPQGVLLGKSNPWTIRTVPFNGWASSIWWTKWGGSDPEFNTWAEMNTGRVGCRS